ncbi:MAG: 4a-hydroxytetrahydrobiopterin dehydratase [Flavobacteriales bacterium]|jgi:4a-hydroxytetrahydrobiopterin dehydratase|nr:4a-hydroxytetrahydrobiopterin dehydratase [Flavobacteriales bacterium]
MIAEKKCIPCQGGIPPLKSKEIRKLLIHLENGWEVYKDKEIRKKYLFSKYTDAIVFSNKIADLAEEEGHHPFIHINYKEIVIILFTHKINGLHENDFILAAKCDLILKSLI